MSDQPVTVEELLDLLAALRGRRVPTADDLLRADEILDDAGIDFSHVKPA